MKKIFASEDEMLMHLCSRVYSTIHTDFTLWEVKRVFQRLISIYGCFD